MKVKETHRSYDALQYPLIFPNGDDGYCIDIPQKNSEGYDVQKKISAKQFYAYRFMIRENNYILKHRQLLNQFVVDMYVKIESERLLFLKLNQDKLRASEYIHLKDSLDREKGSNNVGKMVILPSTFTGSPRFMHSLLQDALTYVRHNGKPSLFITFTCNPKWTELTDLLEPGQQASDRNDIVARVFNQKVKKLTNLVTKGEIFGAIKCFIYSIEWQKRGLPHIHILIWLVNKIQPKDIDKLISAELPNISQDPVLFETVLKHQIHGPCGELNLNCVCMNENKCSKRFPKQFTNATLFGEDGYPQYKRRSIEQGGFSGIIRTKVGNKFVQLKVDNK